MSRFRDSALLARVPNIGERIRPNNSGSISARMPTASCTSCALLFVPSSFMNFGRPWRFEVDRPARAVSLTEPWNLLVSNLVDILNRSFNLKERFSDRRTEVYKF